MDIIKRKTLAHGGEILAVKVATPKGPLLRCVRQAAGSKGLRPAHEILEEIPFLKHRPGPMVDLHVENAEMRDALVKLGAAIPDCLKRAA